MKQTLVLFAFISLLLSSCVKEPEREGSPLAEIITVNQSINTNTTWETNKIYHVTTDINILNSAILTIEPGCIIKFEPATSLIVYQNTNGAIHAIGNKQNKIIFTSSQSRTMPGEWGGIKIFNSIEESIFEHCIIEHAGSSDYSYKNQNSLLFDGAYLSMNNCTIRYSNGNAIRMGSLSKFKSFSNNVILEEINTPLNINANAVSSIGKGNMFDNESQIIVYGDLYEIGDHQWVNTQAAYLVDQYFTVASLTGGPCNLILDAGIQMLCSENINIGNSSSSASLVANGTAQNPIIFRGSGYPVDQSVPGNWNGIIFNNINSNGSLLNHCIITNGGDYWSNISITDMAVVPITISNSVIKNSYSYGIYKTSFAAEPILINNTFENNRNGDKNW